MREGKERERERERETYSSRAVLFNLFGTGESEWKDDEEEKKKETRNRGVTRERQSTARGWSYLSLGLRSWRSFPTSPSFPSLHFTCHRFKWESIIPKHTDDFDNRTKINFLSIWLDKFFSSFYSIFGISPIRQCRQTRLRTTCAPNLLTFYSKRLVWKLIPFLKLIWVEFRQCIFWLRPPLYLHRAFWHHGSKAIRGR